MFEQLNPHLLRAHPNRLYAANHVLSTTYMNRAQRPCCADKITLDSDKGSVHKSSFRVDRSERFYQIDRLLKDRHVVSMTTFLKELEVSRATIKRDLEYLKSRFGA